MIVCRKVNEAVFLQAVLSLVREKKWDLDDLANHFCKSQSIAEPTKSHPSVEEIKVHQAQALAKFLIEQVEPFATNMSSSSSPAQQEIDSLRAQLEAEKARNSQSAESQQAPKRRRLQEKQTAPLPFVLKEDLVQRAVNPEHLGERVLLNQTLGHTKQSINSWVKRLKQTIGATKHDELTAAIARAPETGVIDGHIASPLSLFSFSKRLRRLLQYSMVFTVSFQDWEAFVQQEWSHHKHAVFTRLKYKDAAFIKHSLQDLFIHGRDHAITHGHAFCPQFVWQTYKKTFGDTQVYERLPMQPSQAQEFLLSTCSRSFLQRYKWGINLRTSSLPIAYLLLKQKKDFKGARPIISYIHFLYAKLFRATAIALDVIMRATCPRSFGLHTFPSILQQLTEFLQMLPDDAHPIVFNQDLVGFFTSIPVFRILNAVKWAVNEYSMLQKTDIDDITFSVNLREQDTKLRVWRGRPRRAAKRTVLIHLSDIVDICQLSCEASVFTVMHKVFRQTRGATIGNQISPMLAGLTVSIEEEIYVRHLQSFFDAYKPLFFCTRYVDNRLVIVSDRILRDHRLQHFLHNNFYQHPVELEHFHPMFFRFQHSFGSLWIICFIPPCGMTLSVQLMSHSFHSKGGSSTLGQNYGKFDQIYNTASRKNMRYAAYSKLSLIRFKCSYVIMDNNNRKFLIRFQNSRMLLLSCINRLTYFVKLLIKRCMMSYDILILHL
ncbi:hypothetical protein AK812_SmicGene20478 [Symbiodinium microadriaticum]|uniref:Reverse transcriptase domain-containing protein n=1 Tax=Symbiodinium microadriaticum TaxID=2951 RepID=A0A1Q9DQ09_SYMMI|nr:hypothetical protein AK812_SmicGene20478 [Symbiodinium microadriaticum]